MSVGAPLVVSEREIARSTYITQSGAKTAWDQGYGGKGVTVAILDSGIAPGLSEYSGRIHGDSGNYTEDSRGNVVKVQPVSDDEGHGTWVASVLAAGANDQRTVGVAPDATILALGFYGQADMTGPTSMLVNLDRISAALAQSRTSGASIVNGSFGVDGDFDTLRNAIRQSVAAGQLLVFSAGNEGQANPSLPARYAKETWANGQIIAVGAVDANNRITDYSNRAGDTMLFYLVARGDVLAADKNGSVVSVAGTSFSAPQVAGAAALLKEKWPLLTAAQIAGVLFASATDLGDAGVDPIYGRGLLNIDRAMQPIGQPTVAMPGGGAVPLAGSSLSLAAGGVAASLARAAAQGAFTVAATDSFGRDFKADLAPLVSRASSLAATDLQQSLVRDLYGLDRAFGSLRFSLTPFVENAGDRPTLTAKSFFGYGERGGWQFAGGSTDRLGHFFGLEDHAGIPPHPYFSLVRDGQFGGAGLALSDHLRFRAGALASPAGTGEVVDLAYSSRDPFQNRPRGGDWELALTAGALSEKERFLGMAGVGAFALPTGRSNFTTAGARYRLDAHTEIGGSITLGRTEGGAAGLLRFSPIDVWSADARLTRSDAWFKGDRLSLVFGKPMVVSHGTLDLTLPARVSNDGRLGFRDMRVDLGGSTESRLGATYSAPVGKIGKLSASGMYRLNADNDPSRRETIVGFQYRQPF